MLKACLRSLRANRDIRRRCLTGRGALIPISMILYRITGSKECREDPWSQCPASQFPSSQSPNPCRRLPVHTAGSILGFPTARLVRCSHTISMCEYAVAMTRFDWVLQRQLRPASRQTLASLIRLAETSAASRCALMVGCCGLQSAEDPGRLLRHISGRVHVGGNEEGFRIRRLSHKDPDGMPCMRCSESPLQLRL